MLGRESMDILDAIGQANDAGAVNGVGTKGRTWSMEFEEAFVKSISMPEAR